MKDIINGFREHQIKLNKSEKTIKTYVEYIEKFIKEYDITVENIEMLSSSDFAKQFLEDELAKGFAPGTINRKKNTISVFSNYLMFLNMIPENKFKQLSSVKDDHKKVDVYTDEQLEKMLDYLDNKITENNFQRKVDLKVWKMQRCIIHLLMTSGMRISEVVKMRINDFDLSNGNAYAIRGKGFNGNISRKNAFNKEVAEELKDYLKIRSEIKIAEGDEKFLFISPLNKKHINEQTVRMFVKRMFKEIGIEGTLHEYRHTKATDLINKGIDVKKVSLFLGHANQNTTERYYIKGNDDTMEELANL